MPDLTHEVERWRAAIDSGAFGLWDLDPRGEIVQYTPQWKARLGFGQIGSPDSTSFWRSRVHPDDFDRMLRALRLHLDGYTSTYEMRFRLRAGDFRYVAVLSRGRVVERDHRGNSLRMIGTMVDLTRRLPLGLHAATEGSRPADCALLDTARLHEVGDLLDIAVREGTP